MVNKKGPDVRVWSYILENLLVSLRPESLPRDVRNLTLEKPETAMQLGFWVCFVLFSNPTWVFRKHKSTSDSSDVSYYKSVSIYQARISCFWNPNISETTRELS